MKTKPGRHRLGLCLALFGALLLAACRSTNLTAPWPRGADRNLLNQHANASSRITSQNVGRLKLAWRIRDANYVTHAPLVDHGRVYYADWGGVVSAADLKTGEVLWMTEAEKPRLERPWHGYCGTGVLAHGVLFEASAEGRAFAFDARTGRLLWQQRFTSHPDAGCRGDLLYFNGRLYVPVSTVEEPAHESASGVFFRGSVVALDATDGHRVWEEDLVSVGRTPVTGLVGVMVPGGFALDPKTEVLFVTTGHIPGIGSSMLTDSILALEARTGDFRWAYPPRPLMSVAGAAPPVPRYGFSAAPQLYQARVHGEQRRLVAAGDKSGRFWVLDRDNGNLVWSTVLGTGGAGGGIAADASIEHGRVFLWSNQAFAFHDPPGHPMSVGALDGAAGTFLWSVPKAQPAGYRAAGFLARDVYLVGSLDGKVRAYRASDGQRLWTSPLTGPIASGLVVTGGRLLFATGVPPSLGGQGKGGGVFAFALTVRSGANYKK